ncbi:MAG: hypothetical protein AB7O88_04525 [Reyranellaceae bacterium]
MPARTTAEAILLGVASIAILTWAAPMLGRLELVWRAVFLVPAIVFLATVGFRASPLGGVPAYIGLFLLAVPPLVALGAVDTPLVGGVAVGPVEMATDAWWATGFRLTDAVVRADLKSTVNLEVVTSANKPRRTAMIAFQAAPVVSREWTAAQPVRVWMIEYRKPPIDWSQVPAAGVRWRQDDDNDRAIEAIETRARLVSADGRILLMAHADPEDKLRSQMLWLGWIIGVASLAWTAFVVVGARIDRA